MNDNKRNGLSNLDACRFCGRAWMMDLDCVRCAAVHLAPAFYGFLNFMVCVVSKCRRLVPANRLMLSQLRNTLVALVVLSSFASTARAALVHGDVDIAFGGFDFSEQRLLPPGVNPKTDLIYAVVVSPPLGPMFYTGINYSYILAVPDSTLDQVTVAPEDSSVYSMDAVPVLGRTYIVKTSDGFYAKFALREFTPDIVVRIEYYVQMDGTNNLDTTTVPVEQVTWGRIKSLYAE